MCGWGKKCILHNSLYNNHFHVDFITGNLALFLLKRQNISIQSTFFHQSYLTVNFVWKLKRHKHLD
jgi:hypothetical protein